MVKDSDLDLKTNRLIVLEAITVFNHFYKQVTQRGDALQSDKLKKQF